MKKQIEILLSLGACDSSIDWLKTQPDFDTAWANCHRSDWMFWLLGRAEGVDWKKIAFAACAIAKTALKYLPADELCSAKAIEVAEKYLRGEIGPEELRKARRAASAANATYATYAAYAAAYATYAAAYAAAYAASAVANAAACAAAYAAAANAAYAAANAATYADSAAANAASAAANANRAKLADIVRAFFPQPPI